MTQIDSAPAPILPGGLVTFLFADIADSTRLWEQDAPAMRVALARYAAVLAAAVTAAGGVVFKTVGEEVCAAFAAAPPAFAAALAIQRGLAREAWGATPIQARIGIHSGPAEPHEGDYSGPALNRVARVRGAGHGGQVLCTAAARD